MFYQSYLSLFKARPPLTQTLLPHSPAHPFSLLWCSFFALSPLHFPFAVWRWTFHTVLEAQQSLLCLVCMRIHEKPKDWGHHTHTGWLVLGRYRVRPYSFMDRSNPQTSQRQLFQKFVLHELISFFPLNISNPVFFFLHYLYLPDLASF